MAGPVGLQVVVRWRADAPVPERTRRLVDRLLVDLAPHLNEFEAALFDLAERVSTGAAFLMPEIALNLPVYEEKDAFTIRMRRVDGTRMWLTRKGDEKKLADVLLS